MPQQSVSEILAYLVGEQLSAVTFVQDYLQLHFDGPRLNVTGAIEVTADGSTVRAWESGFRDRLCAQIAKTLVAVASPGEKRIHFDFSDGSRVAVSLEPDAGLPEAVFFHDERRNIWFAV